MCRKLTADVMPGTDACYTMALSLLLANGKVQTTSPKPVCLKLGKLGASVSFTDIISVQLSDQGSDTQPLAPPGRPGRSRYRWSLPAMQLTPAVAASGRLGSPRRVLGRQGLHGASDLSGAWSCVDVFEYMRELQCRPAWTEALAYATGERCNKLERPSSPSDSADEPVGACTAGSTPGWALGTHLFTLLAGAALASIGFRARSTTRSSEPLQGPSSPAPTHTAMTSSCSKAVVPPPAWSASCTDRAPDLASMGRRAAQARHQCLDQVCCPGVKPAAWNLFPLPADACLLPRLHAGHHTLTTPLHPPQPLMLPRGMVAGCGVAAGARTRPARHGQARGKVADGTMHRSLDAEE